MCAQETIFQAGCNLYHVKKPELTVAAATAAAAAAVAALQHMSRNWLRRAIHHVNNTSSDDDDIPTTYPLSTHSRTEHKIYLRNKLRSYKRSLCMRCLSLRPQLILTFVKGNTLGTTKSTALNNRDPPKQKLKGSTSQLVRTGASFVLCKAWVTTFTPNML